MKLPKGRDRELNNLGAVCMAVAILPAIGLWEWIQSAVSAQPGYAMDYGLLALYAVYAVAPVVVGVGFFLRSFLFGYVGGLVFSALSLLYLVLSLSGSESATAFEWMLKTIGPLTLLLLLPTRYKGMFVGASSGSAKSARRVMPE
jgi:hypothetical protein